MAGLRRQGSSPATTGHGGVPTRSHGSGAWGHQEVARAPAHPGEPARGCGGGGARRSGAHGGGRSSGSSGCGATEHEEASGEALQPPGVTMNTVTRVVAGCSGLSDGGDMDGGEELRPWRKRRLRCGNDGEKRGETGRCSRRSRGAAQRARGRPGDGESTAADGGARGGRRWRWRRSRAS